MMDITLQPILREKIPDVAMNVPAQGDAGRMDGERSNFRGTPESANSSVKRASCSMRRSSDRAVFQLHGRSTIVCVRAAFQAYERAHAALLDRRTDLTAMRFAPAPNVTGHAFTHPAAIGQLSQYTVPADAFNHNI
jgi:hypothetical protein